QSGTAKSRVIFPRTRELQSQPGRSVHSCASGFRPRRDRFFFREQFLQCVPPVVDLLEWSPADAQVTATHQKSPLRCVPAQNRDLKWDSYFCYGATAGRAASNLHCNSGGSLPISSLIRSASWRWQTKSASGVRTTIRSCTPSSAIVVPPSSKTMLLLESTAVRARFAAFPRLSF